MAKNDRRKKFYEDDDGLKDQVISIRRVTKVVKGGKNLSFSALVAVGNENGQVGIGKGKAREVPVAIQKGVQDAKKRLLIDKLDNFMKGQGDLIEDNFEDLPLFEGI